MYIKDQLEAVLTGKQDNIKLPGAFVVRINLVEYLASSCLSIIDEHELPLGESLTLVRDVFGAEVSDAMRGLILDREF